MLIMTEVDMADRYQIRFADLAICITDLALQAITRAKLYHARQLEAARVIVGSPGACLAPYQNIFDFTIHGHDSHLVDDTGGMGPSKSAPLSSLARPRTTDFQGEKAIQ
jgi:hypothetical protein